MKILNRIKEGFIPLFQDCTHRKNVIRYFRNQPRRHRYFFIVSIALYCRSSSDLRIIAKLLLQSRYEVLIKVSSSKITSRLQVNTTSTSKFRNAYRIPKLLPLPYPPLPKVWENIFSMSSGDFFAGVVIFWDMLCQQDICPMLF